MLLFPNTLCCSLYERNCICAVIKIFTKFLPANNFCQLLRGTRKRSCTSAGNAQAQLHFRVDQQRAFGIRNISNCLKSYIPCLFYLPFCTCGVGYVFFIRFHLAACRSKSNLPTILVRPLVTSEIHLII